MISYPGKNKTVHYETALEQERLILEATELVEDLITQQGISRKELADRLGKTKAHVSQLLSGERNLTLKTLADVALALGHRVHVAAQPVSAPPGDWHRMSRRENGVRLQTWTNSDAWFTWHGTTSAPITLFVGCVQRSVLPAQHAAGELCAPSSSGSVLSASPWMDLHGARAGRAEADEFVIA